MKTQPAQLVLLIVASFAYSGCGHQAKNRTANVSNTSTASPAPASNKRAASHETTIIQFHGPAATTLDDEAKNLLNQAAAEALEDKDLGLIVNGYSSSDGSWDVNLRVSYDRARAVEQYLLEVLQVRREQVHAIPMGDRDPVADNSTPEGRERNRRVEVKVTWAKEVAETLDRSAIALLSDRSYLPPLNRNSDDEMQGYGGKYLSLWNNQTALFHGVFASPTSNLPEGVILFNPPSVMTVGMWSRVEALVSSTFSEALLKELKESTVPQQEPIRISTIMRVSLSAIDKDDFNISLAGDDKSSLRAVEISGGSPTKWEWDVKPLRSGHRKFHIIAEALITREKDSIPRFVQTFDREITVKSDYVYSTKEAFSQYWQFFSTAIAIPLIVFGWNVYSARRKRIREESISKTSFGTFE